jgi:hypothetical protein
VPKRRLFQVSVTHDKSKHEVFVHWIDGVTSGTISLTPEEATSIGRVGEMARAYRDDVKND